MSPISVTSCMKRTVPFIWSFRTRDIFAFYRNGRIKVDRDKSENHLNYCNLLSILLQKRCCGTGCGRVEKVYGFGRISEEDRDSCVLCIIDDCGRTLPFFNCAILEKHPRNGNLFFVKMSRLESRLKLVSKSTV